MNAQTNSSSQPVLLGLGSNIDSEKNILAAYKLLAEIDIHLKISSIWESAAVGSNGPNYLNGAVLITTQLLPDEIKSEVISTIEDKLGRIRSADKFMDRTIDLDILIYGGSVIDPELWTQAHLAVPASELVPEIKNDLTGKTLYETAMSLKELTEISQRTDLLF